MQRKLPIIAINGVVDKQVSPLDRGFTYGDGVFETCCMVNAKIPLWRFHRERLIDSCDALLIPIQINIVEQYLQQLIEQVQSTELTNAVVKIIVTRGEGGRGYRLPDVINPTICIGVFPAAVYPEDYNNRGVTVRVCNQQLGSNTSLAGLKHLNRLEHILARAEWRDENIAEGLLLDTNGNLIEATVSNIFIVKDGSLLTPDLTQSGVAGVMRRFIMESVASQLNVEPVIKKLTLDDLYSADEVFLCNSVFGVWPVVQVVGEPACKFPVGKITSQLQQLLIKALNALS